MDVRRDAGGAGIGRDRLLGTLEQLLAIEATDLKGALERASDLITAAMGSDKVDVFLHDPSIDSLVAVGTSDTPMSAREREIGMDRLPVANGGRVVGVYQTGEPYLTGRADEDPVVLLGFTQGLGIRSMLCVAFDVGGKRRGVLHIAATQVDVFTQEDLRFLEAAARWVGMVAHRAELAERIAHDAAQAARRATADELVTVLAHDLGNHLTPLKARVDLMRRTAAREGAPRSLEHAEEAGIALSRLNALVADLLDVGRLDRGLFGLELQAMELGSLARQTADVLRMRDARITVRSPGDVFVQGDPKRLLQVLENLLGNALKHSPEGVPVTIEVAEETSGDGQSAIVTVRDEGPGIPPELLPRLFERFAIGPESNGLGLGLYLARGIAEAHGGTLTAESKPGRGAAFRLALPLAPRA
jgi:signal transduction histidine kinase